MSTTAARSQLRQKSVSQHPESHAAPAGQTAALEAETLDALKARSESGSFPRAANWNNPRVAAILDTAAQCFARGGFTATTLADIGKELGLRKSIVHYYFASKGALVQEVQSYAYGRYLEFVREALCQGDGTALGSLRSLWDALNQDATIRGLSIELWSAGRRDGELADKARTLQAETHRVVSEHLHNCGNLPNGMHPDQLATLTLALLDGLIVLAERDGQPERAARTFDSFVAMLSS